ncbi:hypothetical protein H5202_15795 [Shewanella sp. SG41-4]|uniref:hypothetical protein n=1 Tax=Shewanella sp. SG41-4 TaxID=2760976 RepID=UPI0015FFD0E9|nr:hypothetical protein [Shewanella sp. SG41-4]MBB1440110.1 hypothetical protein [Shewanella sp. SG41-4]
MSSFFELNKCFYNPFINFIVERFSKYGPGFYLRGSACVESSELEYKPWDVDLVLIFIKEVSVKDIEYIKRELYKFNVNLQAQWWQHIDLHIINKSYALLDRWVLFNLNRFGEHITGTRFNFANERVLDKKDVLEIYRHYQDLIIKKSAFFLKDDAYQGDANLLKLKVNNLIKTIARCGCIIMLYHQEQYSRDVKVGLHALAFYLCDDSFLNLVLMIDQNDLFCPSELVKKSEVVFSYRLY